MTLRAIDTRMLAFQRILRLRVIEPPVHRLQRNFLPPAGVVARLAALRKAAMVRILVAVRALIERNAHILRLAVGAVGVALRALHLRVQSGQRIARFRVIELLNVDRLPVHEVVALLTIRSQPSLVSILVTTCARRRKSQIGSSQIFRLDRGPLLRGDMRGIVTLRTLKASVLALEHITSLFMVEGLDVPLDQGEIFAVVLGVAACAFLA